VNAPAPLPFLLPWPRLALLIRRILGSQWDAATWPAAKAELQARLGAAPRGGESALVELNRRLATLRAPLGFLTLERHEPELRLLHRYADTWRGIADIVAGMARQEYDLE
jgi:hypothetical protein